MGENIIVILVAIAIIGLVAFVLYIQGWEFRRRAKEIKNMYDSLEEFLIKKSRWSEPIEYPSSFYDIKFQTSTEVIEQLTKMIFDAKKCYIGQNYILQELSENLNIDLTNINKKLMILYS